MTFYSLRSDTLNLVGGCRSVDPLGSIERFSNLNSGWWCLDWHLSLECRFRTGLPQRLLMPLFHQRTKPRSCLGPLIVFLILLIFFKSAHDASPSSIFVITTRCALFADCHPKSHTFWKSSVRYSTMLHLIKGSVSSCTERKNPSTNCDCVSCS